MKVNGIEYGGQHNLALSYLLDADAKPGDAVTATGQAAAGRGAADAPLLGKVTTKEPDSIGAVTKRGVIVVPWNGAAVFGRQAIGVDGAGKAKVSAGGRSCDVIAVDAGAGLAAIDLG